MAVPASILQALIGQTQIGQAAPPFQPGQSLGVGGGDGLFDVLQAIQQFSQPQDIASLTGTQGEELAPQVLAEPAEGTPGFVGPSAPPSGIVQGDQMGPLGKFFGNLDKNIQSPSKLLGLSLLSNIDPRLAQAGLFAGGLFGPNKLF